MELQVADMGIAACIPVDTKLSENPIYFDRSVLKKLEKEFKDLKEIPELITKRSAVWDSIEGKISLSEIEGAFPSVKSGMYFECTNCDYPQWETKRFNLELSKTLFVAAAKIPESFNVEMRIVSRGIEYKFLESKPSNALTLHAVLLGLADET